MTPAMERWATRLREGYTIRPGLRVGPRGYVEWGPALFNPEGAFVQNVRRDTLRKLGALGLLEIEGRDAHDKGGGENDAGEGSNA